MIVKAFYSFSFGMPIYIKQISSRNDSLLSMQDYVARNPKLDQDKAVVMSENNFCSINIHT